MRWILLLMPGIFLFVTRDAKAQGWQWGKTVTHSCYSTGECLSDMSSNSVIDKSGNVITGSYNYNVDSTLYGSTWLKSDTNIFQLVITKLDSSGNFIWAKGTRYHTSLPYQIATDSFDNIYIYGKYSINFSFDSYSLTNFSGGVMFFMAKISPSGTMLWAKNLGSVSAAQFIGGIRTDKDNNVYVSSNFIGLTDTVGDSILHNSSTGGYYSDFYIAKFDSTGNNIWTKTYGGMRNVYSNLFALLPNGESYVTFFSDSTFSLGSILITSGYYLGAHHNYLAKFNSSGTPLWAVQLPNHLTPTQTISDFDGSLYLSGYMDSSALFGSTLLTNYGGKDAFIAKFDSTGSLLWAKNIGGTNNEFGEGVAIDTGNNVWIAGGMYMSPGYTINASGHILTEPTGSTDPLFIIEYDKNGNYLNSMLLKSGGDDWLGMAFDKNDNFYLCSDYYQTSMIFGCDTLPYPTPDEEAIFIAKYSSFGTQCSTATTATTETIRNISAIKFYPNPATTSLTISAPDKITTITITNLLGQVVHSQVCNATQVEVDVAKLPSGVYFVKINGTEVRKFVKE